MRPIFLPATLAFLAACAAAPPAAGPSPCPTSEPTSIATPIDAVKPALPNPSGPNRLIVHVDNVRPDKAEQFEAARVKFVGDLRQRGVDDRRGHYFKIGDTRFYSVVSFRTFAELDALGRARTAAQEVMKGTIEEYDRLADEGLVFPHGNELWTERVDLSHVPTGRPLEAAVELVVEEIDPTCDYAAAWKPVAERLAATKYPYERRAFSSSYGTGRMMVFWLGDRSAGPRPPIEPVPCVLRAEASPARFMGRMSLP